MNFQMIQNVLFFEDTTFSQLVGRQQEMTQLESYINSEQPVIMVQGPTGIGKTTLVRNFIKKMTEKEAKYHQIFWFSLPNVRTIEFLLNSIAAHSPSNNFFTATLKQKIDQISYILTLKPHTIVIDNFEKATGSMSEYLDPVFPDEEMKLLKELFFNMNGIISKFILISSEPDELFYFERDPSVFSFFPVKPLDQQSSNVVAKKILQPYDIQIDFKQKEMQHLMKIMNGHPLSMQIFLPRLQYQRPESLIARYHSHRHHVMRIGNTTSKDFRTHLMAMIDMVVSDLPSNTHYLLPALSLYEGSIETDMFQSIINIYQSSVMGLTAENVVKKIVKDLISFFEHNNLISKYIPGTENYQIVPVLTEYLRRISMSCEPENVYNDWAGAFVHVIARLATNMKSLDSYSKQIWCYFNDATFHRAYDEARKQNMFDHAGILMQIIAALARANRNLAKAERCFVELVAIHQALEDPQMQGITLFQLAHIAEEQGQHHRAKLWLQKALDIFEKSNRVFETASVQHQLGRVSHETGNSDVAEQWLKLAFKTFTRDGESYEAADISRQLGRIGYEQNDLKRAEKWYERAMEIFELYGDEYRAATIYQQLGVIATDRREHDISEHWFHKAMKIYEKMGMTQNLITIYQKAAETAQAQGEYESAEMYYARTFAMVGNTDPHTVAILYKGLGKMSQNCGKYDQASKYYQMARAILDRIHKTTDPEYGELMFDISILEGLKGRFEISGKLLIQSLKSLNQTDTNDDDIQFRVNNFKLSYLQAQDDEKKRLREYWEKHMGSFPIKG
jgi:tetratricopeptide (TPR) repeat protein/DNA polymerase III delta prime subunit